ncbi:TetR/AcrR family transcriptional regulator [Streptomyces sp. NPDC055239]
MTTAALDLLDAVGVEDLTMRRLAERVGVQAGALYRHFATKHDLLTAMAERMLEDVRAAGSAEEPETVDDLAHALRHALLARRDGARVYAGTHPVGPHTLAYGDRLVAALLRTGLSVEDSGRAFLAVVNYTVGHTLEEQASTPSGDDGIEGVQALGRAVHEGDYAHLALVLPALTDPDFEQHFALGLQLLMEGVRARASEAARPASDQVRSRQEP